MNNHLIIREAVAGDLETIERLAHAIWPQTYGAIISAGQIRYMLQLIYSQPALQQQMQQQHQFLIAELDAQPVGYADYSPYAPGVYKLHKIYVDTGIQGKGVGKVLIDYITAKLLQQNVHTLRLNVNRLNKARYFYEKLGFTVTGKEDIDIGNDYFMNDYIMEKQLSGDHA